MAAGIHQKRLIPPELPQLGFGRKDQKPSSVLPNRGVTGTGPVGTAVVVAGGGGSGGEAGGEAGAAVSSERGDCGPFAVPVPFDPVSHLPVGAA